MRMGPPSNALVSIVICSIDADKFARVSENYARLYAGREFELIGVHDARSLAEGYNRGIARSRGDVLILSHDDIEILTPDFAARVRDHLSVYDLIGVAGTTRLVAGKWSAAGDPYLFTLMTSPFEGGAGYATAMLGGGPLVAPGIQALDGVLLALRREVAEAIPFDGEVFDGFHLYDLDFSYRAYRAGFKLAVCRDIAMIHQSTGHYDSIWEAYKRRFEAKYRADLPAAGTPRVGARASFSAATREEILRCCATARLADIAAQIGRANAAL
jgi:GT2 family glycosyltransferase